MLLEELKKSVAPVIIEERKSKNNEDKSNMLGADLAKSLQAPSISGVSDGNSAFRAGGPSVEIMSLRTVPAEQQD